MHRNKRSLLDYAPAEAQQDDHAYIHDNRLARRGNKNPQPQQKGGLKSLADVFSNRHKNRKRIKPDEVRVQSAPADEQPRDIHIPIQEQKTIDDRELREYYQDPDKPLLDLVAIIISVWQKKYLIAILAVLGAVIGILLALSTPHKYYAESQIFLDPRELRLTETDLSNNPVSADLLLALVDTQMRVATSTTVLENTIDELGLTNDPEFSGDSGGIGAIIKGLFSSSSSSATSIDRRVLTQLRKSLSVGRDPETLVVSLGVTTLNAEKSALISNTIVEQFLKEFSLQKSGFFNQTSSSIQSRLNILRLRLDEAENAIVKYRSDNDIIDVGGGVINQKEMLSLSDNLAKIRADKIAKGILATELSKVDVNAVISGSFPEAALTDTLSELRKQYSTVKSTSDALAVGLGPRHPQLVAAQASVKALETDIRDELRRIIAAAQREARRIQQSEAELAAQLAVLKSKSSDESVENIELEELTRKASSLRALYEQLLKSSSEIAVQGELSSSKIQVISQAESPESPSTVSRKITVILFTFLGGMLGMIYAMVIGAWRGIQQNYISRPLSPNAVPQENAQVVNIEQNVSAETSAPYRNQGEPTMRTPSQDAHYGSYAMNGAQSGYPQQNYTPNQAQTQTYVDPRVMPVAAYQSPMPQAVYANGQPMHVYQNVMPQPVVPQHAFVQPVEQVTPQHRAEPDALKDNVSTQEQSSRKAVDSAEYQRLHNEVQRVRSRLESWVKQNNRDMNSPKSR